VFELDTLDGRLHKTGPFLRTADTGPATSA
jgi:hypothetical protein